MSDPIPTATVIPPATKPGYLTTEFWLALFAKLLGALMASGYLAGHNTALQIAGLVTVLLAQLGYTASRVMVKTAAPANDNAPVATSTPIAQAGFFRIELAVVMIVIAGIVAMMLAACSSPAVKNAEHAAATAGLQCAKVDVLQPVETEVEGQTVTLLSKVSDALLHGGGQTVIDTGIAMAKSDLAALPSTLESAAVDCAIKTAIAAYEPLASGHGFAGGDGRLSAATTIGERLLAEHGHASP